MKFLYSDTQDYVNPNYDFINDCHEQGHKRYWDDKYAHEIVVPEPYDGLLMSMSSIRQIAGVSSSKVRYSTAEEQRLLREGARKFLRYDQPHHLDKMVMGDCGAFAYATLPKPAYSPQEVIDFYTDAEFTHGCSPDHIIFDCDINDPKPNDLIAAGKSYLLDRYNITLTNAEEFLKINKFEGAYFEPIAPIQGWSPESMADAALDLEKMGYEYLAVGGLVPLNMPTIHQVLRKIREKIKPETKIHLLGFAKANYIQDFTNYGITSFDSTSPLIKAFKDNKNNYFMPDGNGGIKFYTAIRIPQATENYRLMQGIKMGILDTDVLIKKEQLALQTLRDFDKGIISVETTLDVVTDYHSYLLLESHNGHSPQQLRELEKTRALMKVTLQDKPWQTCQCSICQSCGVEVIIFRGSNRNKRRGFHNLSIYHTYVQNILEN
ncbi:tRNA-guanine transglycosylase DpdA [Acinetobacter baumannii]